MILVDTSAVLALSTEDHPVHREIAAIVAERDGPFVLSPFVFAELDYLLFKRAGRAAQLELVRRVEQSGYQLAPFHTSDVYRARLIMERFAALNIGLADASIVVLAERHNVHDVLTLDQRHFRTLPGPAGKPFRILPADA